MELIVNNEALLRKACEPVTIKEGREIARKLVGWIERNNKKAGKSYTQERKIGLGGRPLTALGIAAPQLGIHKRVAVATIKGRLIPLINPNIIDYSKTLVPWEEMCLSFPAKRVDTFRHVWVEVQCDNWPSPEVVGPLNVDNWTHSDLQSSVCVQHEVSHLAGLLFFDFVDDKAPNPLRWFND